MNNTQEKNFSNVSGRDNYLGGPLNLLGVTLQILRSQVAGCKHSLCSDVSTAESGGQKHAPRGPQRKPHSAEGPQEHWCRRVRNEFSPQCAVVQAFLLWVSFLLCPHPELLARSKRPSTEDSPEVKFVPPFASRSQRTCQQATQGPARPSGLCGNSEEVPVLLGKNVTRRGRKVWPAESTPTPAGTTCTPTSDANQATVLVSPGLGLSQ